MIKTYSLFSRTVCNNLLKLSLTILSYLEQVLVYSLSHNNGVRSITLQEIVTLYNSITGIFLL